MRKNYYSESKKQKNKTKKTVIPGAATGLALRYELPRRHNPSCKGPPGLWSLLTMHMGLQWQQEGGKRGTGMGGSGRHSWTRPWRQQVPTEQAWLHPASSERFCSRPQEEGRKHSLRESSLTPPNSHSCTHPRVHLQRTCKHTQEHMYTCAHISTHINTQTHVHTRALMRLYPLTTSQGAKPQRRWCWDQACPRRGGEGAGLPLVQGGTPGSGDGVPDGTGHHPTSTGG